MPVFHIYLLETNTIDVRSAAAAAAGQVKVLTTTPKGPLPEVQIQMEEKMPMYMLKAQIEEKTGEEIMMTSKIG